MDRPATPLLFATVVALIAGYLLLWLGLIVLAGASGLFVAMLFIFVHWGIPWLIQDRSPTSSQFDL